MTRSLAWCLALSVLVLGAVVHCEAAAQSFWDGTSCDGLARCVTTGGASCGADNHPVMVGTACFCAPGPDDGTPPTLCCTAGSSCPAGSMCALFSDATAGGLCVGTAVTYCNVGPTSVSREDAVQCHTRPDGSIAFSWAQGDCDGDGRPNGEEARDPLLDPCVHDDFGACEDAGMPDSVCCTLSPEPFACCADSEDPIACCGGNPLYSECCFAAEEAGRVSLLECCVGSPSVPPTTCCSFTDGLTGEACCEALGGPMDLCCEVGILPEAACSPPDAGVPPVDDDAGPVAQPDAGVVDPTMDAGARVDGVSFGGGGGCVCTVGSAARPSLLAVLLGLAVAIPGARHRRR